MFGALHAQGRSVVSDLTTDRPHVLDCLTLPSRNAGESGCAGSHDQAPTSKRAKRVTVTPAASSTALTLLLLSVTDGWSSSTTSL